MPTFEGEKVESRVFEGELVEPAGEQPDSGELAFLNRGIAQLFGMPVDLVNLANEYVMDPAYRAMGLPESAPLPGGSRTIERGMQAAGVPVPEPGEEADDFGDVAMREIGAGIGSLVPMGAGMRAAQTAAQAGRGGAVTRSLAEAGETMARKPKSSTALEAASIGGAGVGAGAGQQVGEGSDYEQSLEVLGALAGGLSPATAMTAPSTVKLGARAARAAVDPFTREGATFRAARRAQELAADPRAAAQRLADEDILPEARGVMPPAQRTGEGRLVALQRKLTGEDAALEQRLAERTQTADEIARREAENIGGAPRESAREFLGQRRSRAIERFQERARNAVNRAQERLSKLDVDATPEQESRVVRQELENALKSAQTEENRLWSQVPEGATVEPTTTRQVFSEIQSGQRRLSDPEDVPQIIREGVPALKDADEVGELQTLRSRVLRAAREERAKDAPNRAKIANLERVQQALLEDMGRAEGGETLDQALAFSRVLNQRFRQGPVGRVLGFERQGGPQVAPGETLARTIGRSREAGGEGIDAIQRAMGDAEVREAADEAMNRVLQATQSDEGREAVSRFLQANFRQAAVNPDGSVSPSAARQFLKRNREVLDRLPEVRNRIQQAAEAQRGAERATKQAERVSRQLGQKAKSRLALYLDQSPDRAMQRVIDSNDPGEAAKRLVNAARKDPSGLARRGLKDEFVQTLMRQAETGAVDEQGQRMISGRRFNRLLDNPQAQKVARQILTEEERKRLRQIANTFARLEAGEDKVPEIGSPLQDLASTILEVPARVVGARAGAAAGGGNMAGSIQSAQIFSGRAREWLRNKFSDKAREVLSDAVQSDEMFRTLLTQPTTRPKVRRVERRLNAWLGAPASSAVESEQQPQDAAQNAEPQ